MPLPDFYRRYAELFEGKDVVQGLILEGDQALSLYKSVPGNQQDYRYAEEKWSIREVLAHIIDAERIFATRALVFARGDATALPGFDENAYAREMNMERRPLHHLINEFANLRASSVYLFSSFSEEMWKRGGVASGIDFSVEEIGKIIIGHEMHHRNIINERYLKG